MLQTGPDDGLMISTIGNVNEQNNVVKKYEENDAENEINKYEFLQKKINPFYLPFAPLTDNNDVIVSKPVNTTIAAIVENFDDFFSSVKGTNTYSTPNRTNKDERKRPVDRKRFAVQTYNINNFVLDVQKVRGENPIITHKHILPKEVMDIKSILTLPEAAYLFSRVNLNTPNILDKSNLNRHFLNYWGLLKSKTHVSKTSITDVNSPYNHDSDTFLKSIRNFTLDSEETKETKDAKSKDINHTTYNKFLETIIPKTRFIFNLIKPHLTGNLSVNDILNYLEPFMVYQSDLTFIHYKEMNDYIRGKIMEYRKNYMAKSREYGNIRGSKNIMLPSLIKIFDENANLKTKVLDVYGFTENVMQLSNSDILKRIIQIDNGVFYNNAISLISTNLMIADGARDMTDIDLYLNESNSMNNLGKTAKGKTRTKKTHNQGENIALKDKSGCSKIKVISKRYIALDELHEDDGKEAYFDKKYDSTAYDIGERFKADINMALGEQITHYIDKLMKNKGLDEINARRDAEAIIKGKRIVEDGEYAILETTDETSATLQYYVRKNEKWELDDSIDSETFADDMKMFCNLNEKCIEVKNTCQDEITGANEIKKQNLKLLLSEFDSSLNVNKDILMSRIEDELSNADSRIEKLRNMRILKLYKHDIKKIALGNTLETLEIVSSPYDGLLNTIMGQRDLAKRYTDISRFVTAFAREGNDDNDESPHWFYCIKSNKKMLPSFIYKLATTFLNNGDYISMLDHICAQQGTKSDDGDKWIDKYSGYTIKMIEFNGDEEYNDEGMKIITHSIIEQDAGDLILQNQQDQQNGMMKIPRKYSTPDANKIYNVIHTMSSNMGINLNEQRDFIVRSVIKQITNPSVMATRAKYEKLMAIAAEKNKPIDTYENAYNSKLLFFTLSYYLISIQTSIPPIKTKVTFPTCKKSFSGFPIDGTDNSSGLNYIACVASNLKKSGNMPWSSIAKKNALFIAKQMENFITKFIIPTEDFQNSIKQLNLYMSANPNMNVPEEHNVENWSTFLPPLKKMKLSITQDVGDVFKTKLTDSLTKGSSAQHDYIIELKSKMIMFSFNIIDLIDKTIHGEKGLLTGNNGQPFIENACCDNDEKNTIQYFIKKQPEIAIMNNKVVRLSDLYDDTTRLTKASFLYNPTNTKRKLGVINTAFSENTIYRAFIVYCKFNSLSPLPDNFKAICPTKPDNFNMNDTLNESIRKLKSDARNYNEESLEQLLDVVNNSTKSTLEEKAPILTNIDKLNEIMMDMDEKNVRPSSFRNAFMSVLDEFELNSLLSDTAKLREFKNLLAKLNDDMKRQLIEFVTDTRTKLSRTTLKDFIECLETIVDFKPENTKEETEYKMVNFMKKTMRSLTKEFPNIIMNNLDYADRVKVPTHWKLSGKHQVDVKKNIVKHYDELHKFYEDKQIHLLMEKMVAVTSDINEISQSTLFYTPVEINSKTGSKTSSSDEKGAKTKENAFKYSVFDLDLTTLLFKYYLFTILIDLMSLQNDKDILELPLNLLQEETKDDDDELAFMTKANEMDILVGNKYELSEKIINVMVTFVNLIRTDKKAINYNYNSLMEVILRSKEKEKDDITSYLNKKNDEEREVEREFKTLKLGRWNKGEQKGLHTYQKDTYDEERDEMEKMAKNEVRLNQRNDVTDMNRDIFELDMIAEDTANEEQDREDNVITYMGEDAMPEDYDMDGDENY